MDIIIRENNELMDFFSDKIKFTRLDKIFFLYINLMLFYN